MSTELKNLSSYDAEQVPSGQSLRFGIVVSDWNSAITGNLLEGAYQTLLKHEVSSADILVRHVPGAFELVSGAHYLYEHSWVDAVICLGCVVQGETRHFDYICQAVTHGLVQLNLSNPAPFIFGVLTVDNMQQAIDRSGGKHGNKGVEAAVTAIKMVHFQNSFHNQNDAD